MGVNNPLKGRTRAVVAGTAVLALAGGSAAFAAGQIGSGGIRDNSIRSIDVKNKSLQARDLTPNARAKLKGQRGPAGPPGQSLVADKITPPNAGFGGINVVAVPSLPISSGGPSSSQGAELWEPIELGAGTYLVTTTTQFFDFDPSPSPDEDYGVARLFLEGAELGESWTPVVPDDANNAAQAGGSIVVTVPAGGGTLSGRAALRGGDDGHAGGNVIVTELAG